jgi:2,5-diamino-6-(ribosylamino)-4(3H)-pyrimidinone 5'-phosphate reductase
MDRPTVVIHNTISLDGQLTGFPVDEGLYYELAAAIPHDAVLSGSGTMLAAARTHGVDLTGEDKPRPGHGDGPLLVVVDSRGRLTRLDWLRDLPFWRDVVILGSRATPEAHRDRLRRAGVDCLITGEDRVDLAAALAELSARYAVTAVRVDAGGTLNGHLLRLGLADELSVVVAPHLAGTATPLAAAAGSPRLTLIGAEELRGGLVRLRYAVSAASGAARGG